VSIVKRASLLGMAVFYVLAGIQHFRAPDFYVHIVPPALPAPQTLVYLSGWAEIFLGLALLVPQLRRFAAWGVIALLVAVFPANLHMWWNDVPMDGRPLPGWFHAVRLPLQGVLILWAWWYTRPEADGSAPRTRPGRA